MLKILYLYKKVYKMFNYKELNNKIGVYKITNRINNKVYIGSSCCNLYKRLTSHYYHLNKNTHTNKHLQSSFTKYGKECFTFEVLEYCSTREETLQREEFYINSLESFKLDKGYNIFQFTDSTSIKSNVWSEEARINRKGFRKGILTSEETKRKMSIAAKGRIVKESTKQKISDFYLNPIVMLTLDGTYVREFKSPTEAARFFNLYDATWLFLILRGKRKTCKGYRLIFKSEYNPENIKRIVTGCTVEVNQYDLQGNFIKSFISFKEAEEEISIKGANSNISACCRGTRKNAYGFIWKYKN